MMPITPRTIFHISRHRHLQIGMSFQHMEADLQHRSDCTKASATAAGLPHDAMLEPQADDSVVLTTFWSWPSLLLVRLSPSSVGPDRPDSLLLVAPDNRGLRHLEIMDANIESMWLVHPPFSGGGQLQTEEIRKVKQWPMTAVPKDRSASFHCVSGAVFVMRQGHMLRVEEKGMHWSTGGKFKLNCGSGEP